MRKYLFLVSFIFIANTLPAQNLEIGLAYPLLTYSSQYSEISHPEGTLFYGVGVKVDVILKFDNTDLFLKSNINICSYQYFKNNTGAFFNLSFNAFVDYLIYKNFYGGIGMAFHDYAIVPSTEIIQSSVSVNLGFSILNHYYFDMIYDYMFIDNQMKNFNTLFFSIGYKF